MDSTHLSGVVFVPVQPKTRQKKRELILLEPTTVLTSTLPQTQLYIPHPVNIIPTPCTSPPVVNQPHIDEVGGFTRHVPLIQLPIVTPIKHITGILHDKPEGKTVITASGPIDENHLRKYEELRAQGLNPQFLY